MIDWILEPLGKILNGTKEFATLSPAEIWSFLFFLSVFYIAWDKRDRMKKEEAWLVVRTRQLEEEGKKISVMERMADKMASMEMLLTKYLIEKE